MHMTNRITPPAAATKKQVYDYRRGWYAFMRGSMGAMEAADDRGESPEWYAGFSDANEQPWTPKYATLQTIIDTRNG